MSVFPRCHLSSAGLQLGSSLCHLLCGDEQILPEEQHIVMCIMGWGFRSARTFGAALSYLCVMCRGPGDSGGVPAQGGQRVCIPQCLDALRRRLPLWARRGGVACSALPAAAHKTPQTAHVCAQRAAFLRRPLKGSLSRQQKVTSCWLHPRKAISFPMQQCPGVSTGGHEFAACTGT